MKLKRLKYPVLISPNEIPQLHIKEYRDEGIEIGACTTLTRFDTILKEAIEKLPGELNVQNFFCYV